MRPHRLLSAAFVLLAAGCGDYEIASPRVALHKTCPPLPTVADWSESEGGPIVEGPFDDHTNDEWSPGSELIEVRWLPVMAIGGLHEILVYTDVAGRQSVIAGFPEKNEFSILLDYGSLVIQTGPFNVGKSFTEDLSEDSRRRILLSGPDLSAPWAKLNGVAEIIDRLGVRYYLLGPNSNSAVQTTLKYAGMRPQNPGFFGDVAAQMDVIRFAEAADNTACDDPDDKVDQVGD